MKFIIGLLIGGCLVLGWHYMIGASKAELNQEREKAKSALEEVAETKATLEEVKKTDAETLATEKAKIHADYDVQLKAAEDEVKNLNTELLKVRTDLVTAPANLANMVDAPKVAKESAPAPVAPVVQTEPEKPVATPASQPVSVQPDVAQPAPKQPVTVATPRQSSLSGPRPAALKSGIFQHSRLQKKMDGTIVTNYYYPDHP